MSEQEPKASPDRGTTLVEVLVSVMVVGLLATVLAAATIVILRQSDNTTGRLNNARYEQGVGLWLPTDLASAELVNVDPGASPCGTTCPPGAETGGSNALMLTWTGLLAGSSSATMATTTVSYRYLEIDGDWKMVRVECISIGGAAPTCHTRTIIDGLDAPPDLANWVPGTTVPYWVIQVSQPLDPADPGNTGTTIPVDPNAPTKNAKRVVVTINGGSDTFGAAGGGRAQISLSAGGTNRKTIDASSVSGTPSFNEARSRCGGAIALVIDESASIGETAMAQVRSAVSLFVSKFAGTPVQLQIVRFDTQSSVLGATGWSRYYDMLNQTDVDALSAAVSQLRSNGGTNWEDALFRLFYNSDGTVQTIIPETVVFFTDGVPTYSRVNHTSASASTNPPARLAGYPAANGSAYNQEAFYRANYIAQAFRASVNFIGVGVGSGISSTSTWINNAEITTSWSRNNNLVWERNNNFVWQRNANYAWQRNNNIIWQRNNNVVWEQNNNFEWQRNNNVGWQRNNSVGWQRNNNVIAERGNTVVWERGNTVVWERNNNIAYERGYRMIGSTKSYTAPYTSWETSNASSYNSNNTVAGESDGWRTRVNGGLSNTWNSSNQADYEKSNTTSDSNDGWRTRTTGTPSSWTGVTQTVYETYNTTTDSSDGWRTRVTGTPTSWTAATMADFEEYNTTTDNSDGWRLRLNGGLSGSWTAVTQAQFNAYNTTTNDSDGWRPYLSGPLSSSWTTVTQTEFNAYNTTADDTDGWRYGLIGSLSSSWTEVTKAEFDANNTTTDDTDGWRGAMNGSLSGSWTSVTQSLYDTWNTVPANTDGWRTRVNGSLSSNWTTVTQAAFSYSNTTTDSNDGWRVVLNGGLSPNWTSITQTEFNLYNTTSDDSDGWRSGLIGGVAGTWTDVAQSEYDSFNTTSDESDGWRAVLNGSLSGSWTSVSQALYDVYNTVPDTSDGWRTRVSGSLSNNWTTVTQAQYNMSNTTSDNNDGWRVVQGTNLNSTPNVSNATILTRLITGSDNGVPGVVQNGKYINADEADIYILPQWDQFAGALEAVALAECGGTLTLQTKVGGAAAADPFSYQNTTIADSSGAPMPSALNFVTTTRQFTSGTFDFAIPNGEFVTVGIEPQNWATLTGYQPAGWSCKSGNTPRSFTSVPIAGTTWTGIQVRINANEAVSCILNVTRI